MFPVLGSAASAVRAYSRGLLVSAHNIANSVTEDYHPLGVIYESTPTGGVAARVETREEIDGVDLAEETVQMISSQRAIEANLAVARASDKTLGILLDTFV
jgi:flagellar basal body rod protein FlgG